MIKSPEWKAIAVAATVAFLSMSLVAMDAVLDLNISGLSQRLQSAQASFVDTMGQYRLAFATPTWNHDKAPAEPQTSAQPVLFAQPLTSDNSENTGSLADR